MPITHALHATPKRYIILTTLRLLYFLHVILLCASKGFIKVQIQLLPANKIHDVYLPAISKVWLFNRFYPYF